jgi:hypothetical protein
VAIFILKTLIPGINALACSEAALASAQGNEVEPLELLLAASICTR